MAWAFEKMLLSVLLSLDPQQPFEEGDGAVRLPGIPADLVNEHPSHADVAQQLWKGLHKFTSRTALAMWADKQH